jgi:hypothetical protein
MKKLYIFLFILMQAGISAQVFSQTRIDKNILLTDENTITTPITKDQIEVATFPNPASKSITFSIKGIDFSKVEIEIFELTGQPMMTLFPDNNQFTVDVTSFKEGIYFYKIVSSGEILKSEKFIVLQK